MTITGFAIAVVVAIIVIAILFVLVRGALAIIKPPDPIPQVVWLIATVFGLLFLLGLITGTVSIPMLR